MDDQNAANSGSADVEMEEAAGGEPGQQPAKKATWARKPPRRRRLYSRNARNGVDTKIGSIRAAVARAAAASDLSAATEQLPTPAAADPPLALTKQTAEQARKELGYAKRSLRLSKRNRSIVEQELKVAASSHTQALEMQQSKLAAKSQECRKLAALAQSRRKEANEAKTSEIQAQAEVARHRLELSNRDKAASTL